MSGKIIIYEVLDDLGKERSLKSLENYLSGIDPSRIFITLENSSQDVYDFLFSKYGNIPIEIVECRNLGNGGKCNNPDIDVKKKILDLGLETVAHYVQANNKSIGEVNSEITLTLFRAFFIFYSSAMPDEYEVLFEERRMCIYGKLIDRKFMDGDVLITSPWDSYWFYDKFN
ncbi:hypothetical protein ACNF42_05670 [Cuniculiplasma sp. SKW3]|uniref:hypothetical protein n=1 Tax=Cuniculiplasma sp. SKW3 TaxID=3400170 RepID=UPI003FD1DA60